MAFAKTTKQCSKKQELQKKPTHQQSKQPTENQTTQVKLYSLYQKLCPTEGNAQTNVKGGTGVLKKMAADVSRLRHTCLLRECADAFPEVPEYTKKEGRPH